MKFHRKKKVLKSCVKYNHGRKNKIAIEKSQKTLKNV